MPQSTMTLQEAISAALSGRKSMVRCPAHDDGTASLSVAPGGAPPPGKQPQPVVFHCHAECSTEDILREGGVDWADVMRDSINTATVAKGEWTPAGDASHVYDYVDEQGTLLFQALRVPKEGGGKTFFQRRPDLSRPKGWDWSLGDVRRVLYRLPQLIEGVSQGRTIYIAEGEKDVEALRWDGNVATCNPMGALKWQDDFTPYFAGAHVVIVADNDDKGREHARMVREALVPVASSVTVVETTMPKCKDYSDHRAKGGTLASMVTTFTTEEQGRDDGALDLVDMIATEWDTGTEIIPGYLAKANVVLLTGFEGHGKSTLLRQIAVCCAAGIHPFHFTPMPSLKVMVIDAENPEHQQVLDWRKLARLAHVHTGEPIPKGRLIILSEWTSEPDLTSTQGQDWLFERMQAYSPDLVVMGPVQNLVSRDVKEDEVVRKLKRAVNGARAINGAAFMLEHHSPHKMAGDSQRSTRPYGSSLFQKWPDFGYGLAPRRDDQTTYDLHANRKPRVRSRAWPEVVRWGSTAPGSVEWPWMFEETELRGSKRDKDAERSHLTSVS